MVLEMRQLSHTGVSQTLVSELRHGLGLLTRRTGAGPVGASGRTTGASVSGMRAKRARRLPASVGSSELVPGTRRATYQRPLARVKESSRTEKPLLLLKRMWPTSCTMSWCESTML
jgi:hypothetical protein